MVYAKAAPSVLIGIALMAASTLGCSQGGLETIPVSGSVTAEGGALPQICRVYFLPVSTTGPKRPAMAQASEDGAYSVSAFKGSEGLLPGTYKVNVQYMDLKPGANPELDGSWAQNQYAAGEIEIKPDSEGVEYNIAIPLKR